MNITKTEGISPNLLIVVIFILFINSVSANAVNNLQIKITQYFLSDNNQLTIRLSGLYLVENTSDINNGEIKCKDLNLKFTIIDSDDKEVGYSSCISKVESNNGDFGVSNIEIETNKKLKINDIYKLKYEDTKACVNDNCTILKRGTTFSQIRKLHLDFHKYKTNEIIIKSHSNLDVASSYKVTVTRGEKVIFLKNNEINVIYNSPKSVSIIMPKRFKNKDKVKVITFDAIGELAGSKIFKHSRPKNSDEALSYLSVSFEKDDNRDQQFQYAIKYKYDISKDLAKNNPGFFGRPSPVIDIDLNNKDKEAKQSASIKLLWSKYTSTIDKSENDYQKQWYHDVGVGLEMEDNLKNKNLVLSYLRSYKTATKSRFNNSFGIDVGRNFGLTKKVDATGALDNYTISRFVLNLGYTYVNEKPIHVPVDSITFSLSNKMKYLFTNEVHVRTIKGDGEDIKDADDYYYDKGLKELWEAEILFGLSDRLGISLNYENGKVPQFYRDNDKISLSLVYSY